MSYAFNIEDMPLDTWNGFDEENDPEAVGGDKHKLEIVARPAPVAVAAATTLVPFTRDIKFGAHGNDVFALKRALSVAGFGKWGKWGLKNYMGIPRTSLLKKWEASVKRPTDGIYTLADHKLLASKYDEYGRWLMISAMPLSPEEQKRNKIVATAFVGYNNRVNIHYTQSALRMQGVRQHILPPKYPNWEDCSSFATWCYWVSGAPDPNGLGYNGYGYTGTQVLHGHTTTVVSAKPGDLFFYGSSRGIPTHVAVYVGGGRVISHGSEAGPLLLAWNYRNDLNQVRSYF